MTVCSAWMESVLTASRIACKLLDARRMYRRLPCSCRSFAMPVSYAMAYCREQPRSMAATCTQRPDEDAHRNCAVQIEMARRAHTALELGGCWYEAGPRSALSGSLLQEQRAAPTYLSSHTAGACACAYIAIMLQEAL